MAVAKRRSPERIVAQTNELARQFYKLIGYERPVGFPFDEATHPQERAMWDMACKAQEMLTGTDAEEALSDIDGVLYEREVGRIRKREREAAG